MLVEHAHRDVRVTRDRFGLGPFAHRRHQDRVVGVDHVVDDRHRGAVGHAVVTEDRGAMVTDERAPFLGRHAVSFVVARINRSTTRSACAATNSGANGSTPVRRSTLRGHHEHGGARTGQQVVQMCGCDRRELTARGETFEHRDRVLVQRPHVRFDHPVETSTRPFALLHDDPVQLRVRRGELDEVTHHQLRDRDLVDAAQTGEPTLHRGAEPLEQIVDRGAPQLFLAGEVVVEQRLGHPGELGDAPGSTRRRSCAPRTDPTPRRGSPAGSRRRRVGSGWWTRQPAYRSIRNRAIP